MIINNITHIMCVSIISIIIVCMYIYIYIYDKYQNQAQGLHGPLEGAPQAAGGLSQGPYHICYVILHYSLLCYNFIV